VELWNSESRAIKRRLAAAKEELDQTEIIERALQERYAALRHERMVRNGAS
jgi:hypothetical protein